MQDQIELAAVGPHQIGQLTAGIAQTPVTAAARGAAPLAMALQIRQHIEGVCAPELAEAGVRQGKGQGPGIQFQADPLQLQPLPLGRLQQGGAVVAEAHADIEHPQAAAGGEAQQ